MSRTIKVLDGGSATELVRLGATDINDDPLWSARLLHSNPNLIKQMHKNFLEMGSELLTTVSYQASVEGFSKYLNIGTDEASDLIKRSTQLAVEACREVVSENGVARIVAGSVGPYGACLCDGSEYTGTYAEKVTSQEMIDWHRHRIKALVESGCDILAVETIPVLREAEAIIELLKEFPGCKAAVSFSCKDGEFTCHGERFSDAVRTVTQNPCVCAVGINCTSPEYITPLLRSINHMKLETPVLIKPNSGEKWERGKGFYGKEHCTPLCDSVKEWIDLGASWIGGCCRIYPSDVQQIKSVIADYTNKTTTK